MTRKVIKDPGGPQVAPLDIPDTLKDLKDRVEKLEKKQPINIIHQYIPVPHHWYWPYVPYQPYQPYWPYQKQYTYLNHKNYTTYTLSDKGIYGYPSSLLSANTNSTNPNAVGINQT